jgi:FKBP-type peptidyl-prolyl cis-trans isomerase
VSRRKAALLGLVALGLAGCGPRQPEPPPAPEKSAAELRREKWFGAEIARKPGIEWRASGLGIEVLVPGEGLAPQRTDKVRLHYRVRLVDGKEADSSYARGKPLESTVQHLITGWAAALPSMRPGGKGVFYVPPVLGYGGLQAGDIPPNSALVCEVELLEVKPQ